MLGLSLTEVVMTGCEGLGVLLVDWNIYPRSLSDAKLRGQNCLGLDDRCEPKIRSQTTVPRERECGTSGVRARRDQNYHLRTIGCLGRKPSSVWQNDRGLVAARRGIESAKCDLIYGWRRGHGSGLRGWYEA